MFMLEALAEIHARLGPANDRPIDLHFTKGLVRLKASACQRDVSAS
jgi:hypothetical protein